MSEKHSPMWLIVLLAGVLFSPTVNAQAIFAETSDEAISYRHVRETYQHLMTTVQRPLWIDSQGYEYTIESDHLWCAPIEEGRPGRTVITKLEAPTTLPHPRSVLVGPMWNHDAVYVAFFGGDGSFELRQVTCRPGMPISSGVVTSQGQSDLLADAGATPGLMPFVLRQASPQGDLCIWRDDRLVCGGVWVGAFLDTWEVRLTVDQLTEALDEPGLHAQMRPWTGRPHWSNPEPTWRVEAIGWAPDGTLFATVARGHTSRVNPAFNQGVETHHGLTHRFLIEVHPDGTINKRLGPMLSSWSATQASASYWTPLASPIIRYHPDLDAMLIPVSSVDYGAENYELNNLYNPQLWGRLYGVGLAVFPIGEQTSGYISLTSHAARAFHCIGADVGECTRLETFTPGLGFVPGPNGALYHVLGSGAESIGASMAMHELILGDLGKLDLDDDGLTDEEERALGTSPWHKDSDGGGSDDKIEVLLGTNPIDYTDDRARRNHDPLNWMYMESPVVKLAYGAPFRGGGREWAINVSGRGPLCVNGSCHGPDGAVVAEYGQEATGRPGITTSGSTIVFPVGANLHIQDLASGAVNIVDLGAGASELGDIERVYPLDAHRAWLVAQGKLGYWTSTTGLAVVYDQEQARCDSGLGDCRPGQPTARDLHDVATWFDPLGYHFELERFLISVRGRWQFYVVGVHATEPAAVLDTMRSLSGFGPPFDDHPDGFPYVGLPVQPPVSFLLPSQKGHYVTYNGIFGRSYAPQTMGLSANANTFEHAHSVWGGRIIAPSPVSGHVVEFVPYQVGVEPGDSLMLRGYSSESPNPHGRPFDVETSTRYGLQLYRIGPRGGMIPLWWTPQKGYGTPGGMDVSADGNMCAVFPEEGLFVEWSAGPNSNNVPLFETFRGDFINPVDCKYGRDGEVYILGKSPARVEVWDRTTSETRDVTQELGVNLVGEPTALLRTRVGTIEVLSEGSITAKTYMPDGRAVTLRSEGHWASLWVNDIQITFAPLYNPTITGAQANHNLTHGVLVARPDNKVFLVPWGRNLLTDYVTAGRLLVVDLATGEQVLAAHQAPPSGNLGPQPAAAAVPGGQKLDPWTLDEHQLPTLDDPNDPGDAGNNDNPDVGPSFDPTPPPGADPPRGGSPRFGDDDDTSCSTVAPGGPASGATLVLVTVMLLGLHRRRRDLVAVLAVVGLLCGCGDGDNDPGYQGDCPTGATAMELVHQDGTFENWCEVNGGATGPYEHWSADRMFLIVMGQFYDNKASGAWWFNHRSNGRSWLNGRYRSGLAHGLWEEHDEQGQKVATRHYQHGEPCGEWKVFDGGALVEEADFGVCR